MANTTKAQIMLDGPRHLIVRFTGTYVDTAISDVQWVDLDATSHTATVAAGMADGTERVTSLESVAIEELWYSIQGFDGIRLEWDHTTDSVIGILGTGEGYMDFRGYGGLQDDGSGGTGDVLASVVGTPAIDDTYDITIKFRKKWTT